MLPWCPRGIPEPAARCPLFSHCQRLSNHRLDLVKEPLQPVVTSFVDCISHSLLSREGSRSVKDQRARQRVKQWAQRTKTVIQKFIFSVARSYKVLTDSSYEQVVIAIYFGLRASPEASSLCSTTADRAMPQAFPSQPYCDIAASSSVGDYAWQNTNAEMRHTRKKKSGEMRWGMLARPTWRTQTVPILAAFGFDFRASTLN